MIHQKEKAECNVALHGLLKDLMDHDPVKLCALLANGPVTVTNMVKLAGLDAKVTFTIECPGMKAKVEEAKAKNAPPKPPEKPHG